MDIRQSLTYRAARRLAVRPAAVELPRAVVSFCFDDFPQSAADAGATILNDRGVLGSFYACPEQAGQTVGGVRQFDAADLDRLAEAGHEIGCHTASHARLTPLSAAQIDDQIARSRRGLAALGHTAPLDAFAYPFGDVSVRTKRQVSSHFLTCRGVWEGLNHGVIDRGLLSCVCLEEHILKRKPAQAWIDEAVDRRAWLIFLTHDVSSRPTYYGITPAGLEDLVDRVLAAGADILPVTTAFRRGTAGAAVRPGVPAPGAAKGGAP